MNKTETVKETFKGVARATSAINYVVDNIEKGYILENVYEASSILEVTLVKDDSSSSDAKEEVPEITIPEQAVAVYTYPDFTYAETLETSKQLEEYFDQFGFNANPRHRPSTILRKARAYFGEVESNEW